MLYYTLVTRVPVRVTTEFLPLVSLADYGPGILTFRFKGDSKLVYDQARFKSFSKTGYIMQDIQLSLEQVREASGVFDGYYFEFQVSDGAILAGIAYEHGFDVFGQTNNERKKRKKRSHELVLFSVLSEDERVVHQTKLGFYARHKRFGKQEVYFDYRSLEECELDTVVNLLPMAKAYDPWFPKCGARKTPNVLTNFWDISFPLFCPTKKQWEQNPRLQGIRAMENIHEVLWPFYLELFEGHVVAGIHAGEVRDEKGESVAMLDSIKDDSPRSERSVKKVEPGKCYNLEFRNCEFAGSRIIFYVPYKGDYIYIVDAPIKDVALHAFADLDVARDFATGVITAREAKEQELFSLYHTGDNWVERYHEKVSQIGMQH